MRSIELRLREASCGELAAAARAIAAELALRPAPESGVAAMELSETLGHAGDLIEAALAAAVGRVDTSGAHGEFGFPSAVSWLRERLGMRHGRAAERVTLARQLPRLGRVAKLLAGERLSAGFAAVICAAVPRLTEAEAQAAEDILLGMVDDGCDVRQVSRAGERITDLIAERQGRAPEPADSRRGFVRSWLQKAKSLDGGLWIKGWFNPEHSAAFDQIIGPLAKPKAQWDDRDISQRTADALFAVLTEGNRGAGVTLIIDLAAYASATGEDGCFAYTSRSGPGATEGPAPGADPGTEPAGCFACTPRDREAGRAAGPDIPGGRHGEPDAEGATAVGPAPVPRADSETLRQAEAASPPEASSGVDAESSPGVSSGARFEADSGMSSEAGSGISEREAGGFARSAARRPPAALLDGTPVTPEDARRIALNAGINPLVLGHAGIPLYLGRRVRFATSAQRKVLLARYDTCCVVGCRIPAHLSEVHHLGGGWKLGAPTDIDQLAMLCGWHNRWVETHRHQTAQSRDAQGRTVLKILPPWSSRREDLTSAEREPSVGTGDPVLPDPLARTLPFGVPGSLPCLGLGSAWSCGNAWN